MFLPLLSLLACSPESPDDSATPSGWVEVEATLYTDCDGCSPFWRATSPVEGPVPVFVWVTYGDGQTVESPSTTEWTNGYDLWSEVVGSEVSAVYDVWVE